MAKPRLQIYTNQETISQLEAAAAKECLDLNPWALSVLKKEALRILREHTEDDELAALRAEVAELRQRMDDR